MIRLSHFGYLLALLTAGLWALCAGTSWTPTDPPDLWGLIRIVVGLPVVAFVPGVLLAPAVLGRAVRTRGPSDGLDPVWILAGGLGLNLFIHFIHWNLFRLVGVEPTAGGVLPLLLVECVVLAVVVSRRADLSIEAPSRALGLGFGLSVVGLLVFSYVARADLRTDPSWYFHDPAIDAGWADPQEPHAVRFERRTGGGWPERSPFQPEQRVLELKIHNTGEIAQDVPVFFLLHGPVGLSGSLRARDVDVDRAEITELVAVEGIEQPVERYWRWGAAALTAVVTVGPRDEAAVELHLHTPASVSRDALGPVRVLDWSGVGADHLIEELADAGVHHMHPFQLLNVTENVRWAAEISTSWVLPGRSPDGLSTLHQPPAWTYLLAPARVLLMAEGAAASAVFLLVLLGIVAVSLRAVEDDGGSLDVLAAAPLLANALSHGRMMVHDGSLNFPDPLFALALLLCVTAAASGRMRLFVLWALLATLLRYPGAVVATFAAAAVLALDPGRRAAARRALERFGFILAAFCLVMLGAGFVSDRLETWLYALYFETIPEHFRNNPDAPAFGLRPLHFFWFWAQVGGVLLVLAVPFRGGLARVAAATALLYAPFLAFIDHMSHHYFLPLVAFAALAAVSSASRVPNASLRRVLLAGLTVVSWAALYWSTTQRI